MKRPPYRLSVVTRVIRRQHGRFTTAAKRANSSLCLIGKPLHRIAERLDWALLGCLAFLFFADVAGVHHTELHHFESAHLQFSASVIWLGIWLKRQSPGIV